MSGSEATLRRRSHVSIGLLVTSSVLVLVAAVAFDVLAEEPPTHALAVGLAALIVGLGRLRARGRFQGVFAAVNLAVVGQPAVHAVSKLAEAGAGSMPHSHGWFDGLPSVGLHVVVALLVVVIATSEPATRYVASAVVLVLARLHRHPPVAVPPRVVPSDRRAEPPGRERQLLFTRQAHRRGPPAMPALAS